MSYLSLNIRHLRRLRKLTQEQLAQILGIGRTNISNWEKQVSSPDVEQVKIIANYFGISVDDMVSKNLENANQIGKENLAGNVTFSTPDSVHLMADKRRFGTPNKVDTHQLSIAEEQPAPLYQAEKREGEKDWKLLLPGMPGRVRTFSVFGTSMQPALRDGDVIICTKCELSDVEDGRVYAIVDTSLVINVKYAYPYPDGVLLVPANRAEYNPIVIEKKNILEVWKALLLLTSDIKPFGEVGASQDLEKKIDHLEAFVRKLFPDYGEIDGDFGK